MKGKGNPVNRRENIVSIWLVQAGYTRFQVAKLLKIRPTRTSEALKQPKTLTGEHYQLIANATGKPITDILNAVFFNDSAPPNAPELWHDCDD